MIADEPLVVVEDLGKRFRRRRTRLRFLLPWSRLHTPEDRFGDEEEDDEEEDEEEGGRAALTERWGLHGVSLTVAQGEIVAVIGPSGAGKSTLIRVLAGVTPVTTGRAIVRGRLGPTADMAGALMQSHHDVRRNVLSVARFLGASREDALRRLDDIVAFAGLEEHRHEHRGHLPRQLSGRLAFATVLGLEPDLLLADDRIGTGDKPYRERCLEAALEENRRRGMAILFSSNDLALVRRIAHQVVVLEEGRVTDQGPLETVLRRYTSAQISVPETQLPAHEAPEHARTRLAAEDNPYIEGIDVRLLAGGGDVAQLRAEESAIIELRIRVLRGDMALRPVITVLTDGPPPMRLLRSFAPRTLEVSQPGEYLATVELPGNLLVAGQYRVKAVVMIESEAEPEVESPRIVLREALSFSVVSEHEEVRVEDTVPDGAVRPALQWRFSAPSAHAPAPRALP